MTLAEWCAANGWDAVRAMNALQNAGKVSDECVTLEDVARRDWVQAMDYLRGINIRSGKV